MSLAMPIFAITTTRFATEMTTVFTATFLRGEMGQHLCEFFALMNAKFWSTPELLNCSSILFLVVTILPLIFDMSMLVRIWGSCSLSRALFLHSVHESKPAVTWLGGSSWVSMFARTKCHSARC